MKFIKTRKLTVDLKGYDDVVMTCNPDALINFDIYLEIYIGVH